MPLKTIESSEARRRWGELLDEVRAGDSDIAISRYNRTVAVLIPAIDYEELREELEELRLARLAGDIYEEYLQNPDVARPFSEVKAELTESEE